MAVSLKTIGQWRVHKQPVTKYGKKSRSSKAQLQFPVSRMDRFLRQGGYSDRLSSSAPVYMAAVLEYLTVEVMELAGNVARDGKRNRINPRHVMLGIRGDEELNKLLSQVTFPAGGVLPGILEALIPKKRGGQAKVN